MAAFRIRLIRLVCPFLGAKGTSPDQKPGWGVTYIAMVRITVGEGTGAQLIREGCGASHGIDIDQGQAHELALKEAKTHAMKRALMTFGNPFGLALYDKQQREVTGAAGGGRYSSRQPATGLVHGVAGGGRYVGSGSAPSPIHAGGPEGGDIENCATRRCIGSSCSSCCDPPQPQPDPGLAPRDPATIRQLHATIRPLSSPVLEGFSNAFRKRFQVPADASSIADRICQRRHHDCIETFLVQHQS